MRTSYVFHERAHLTVLADRLTDRTPDRLPTYVRKRGPGLRRSWLSTSPLEALPSTVRRCVRGARTSGARLIASAAVMQNSYVMAALLRDHCQHVRAWERSNVYAGVPAWLGLPRAALDQRAGPARREARQPVGAAVPPRIHELVVVVVVVVGVRA